MRSVLTCGSSKRGVGFTLIELLVVMSIIALLLSIVVPRYFHSVTRAREAVLKENLVLVRDALDKHYADTGRYPDTLMDLVDKKYLRKLPEDPITQSADTWIIFPPDRREQGGVYDVKSGAPGNSRSGVPYSQW